MFSIPFFLAFYILNAQNESPLVVFSNRLMINPAFAGIDNETSLHIGNQYYYVDSASSYNLLFFTYDTYSPKLKGGIGLYFQQGIIGKQNISTSELGVSYATIPRKTKNGTIRFAANTGFLVATKNWFVSTLDGLMVDPQGAVNPPGEEFLRYLLLKPRLSFLWDTRNVTWGLTAGYPLRVPINVNEEENPQASPSAITFYISRNREGFKKGLKTKPYVFIPELIVHYQEDFVLSRLNAFIEHTNNTYGAFLQNDFTNNIHCVGITFGLATGNLRINLSTGAGIPGLSDIVGVVGELTIRMIVPQTDYSKFNPWATQIK